MKRAQHEAGERQREVARLREAGERGESPRVDQAAMPRRAADQAGRLLRELPLSTRRQQEEASRRVDRVAEVVVQPLRRNRLPLVEGAPQAEGLERLEDPVARATRLRQPRRVRRVVARHTSDKERKVVEPRQRPHPELRALAPAQLLAAAAPPVLRLRRRRRRAAKVLDDVLHHVREHPRRERPAEVEGRCADVLGALLRLDREGEVPHVVLMDTHVVIRVGQVD